MRPAWRSCRPWGALAAAIDGAGTATEAACRAALATLEADEARLPLATGRGARGEGGVLG